MKKKLDVTVYEVKFASYTRNEKKKIGKHISRLVFDGRHDFLIDEDLDGIAAKIELENERFGLEPERGVRRRIQFELIDQDERMAVFSLAKNIYITKDEFMGEYFLDFNLAETPLQAGHTYRLIVKDLKNDVTLGVSSFHVFGEKELGAREDWYCVCDGGIRPSWEKEMYRSLKVIPYRDYWIRFNLSQKFGQDIPPILPELEIRLYNTVTGRVDVCFAEPICRNFEENQYFVEQPFVPSEDDRGLYYAELICMDCPLAGFMFDSSLDVFSGSWYGSEIEPLDEYSPEAAKQRAEAVLDPLRQLEEEDSFDKIFDEVFGHESEESDPENLPDADDEAACNPDESESEGSAQSFSEKLSLLTGLHSVKKKLLDYENIMRFNLMRSERDLPVLSLPLHSMFLGSPGTGKTTVAKMVGEMLHGIGLLSRGHVVVRERATLLGQFYNSEAEKTLEALEQAQGGILFIDEAYQLHQPSDARDPGKFVIETLLTALADDSNRDWMVILAGYPAPMEKMLDMNPGFKSRIPDTNIYRFEDFTENELLEIARNYLTRQQYCLTPEADEVLEGRLKSDYDHRDRNFGNARHVMNLIQTEILPAMARRVVGQQGADSLNLTDILACDIQPVSSRVVAPRPRLGYAC